MLVRILKSVLTSVLIALLVPLTSAAEERLRFAVIAKVLNAPFFQEVGKGCQHKAKAYGFIDCLFDGPPEANVRLQEQVISKYLHEGVDGIAIAIQNPHYHANHSLKEARLLNIPVITFDSDLVQTTTTNSLSLRSSYVGTDNSEMGRRMGRYLLNLKPSGGVYSIISGHRSAPNLSQRVEGVRKVLAESNWIEHSRSPLYSQEDGARALKLMDFFLKRYQESPLNLTAIISVGGWPQKEPANYRALMTPYKNDLESKSLTIVIGDTSVNQVSLLEEGLASINVGQNPFEMGEKAIEILYSLYRGYPVEEVNFTSLNICSTEQSPTCFNR